MIKTCTFYYHPRPWYRSSFKELTSLSRVIIIIHISTPALQNQMYSRGQPLRALHTPPQTVLGHVLSPPRLQYIRGASCLRGTIFASPAQLSGSSPTGRLVRPRTLICIRALHHVRNVRRRDPTNDIQGTTANNATVKKKTH